MWSGETAIPVMASECDDRFEIRLASTFFVPPSLELKLGRVTFRRRTGPSWTLGPKSCCNSRLLSK